MQLVLNYDASNCFLLSHPKDALNGGKLKEGQNDDMRGAVRSEVELEKANGRRQDF